jgi:DNA-binding transcriptional ArsR family regulator
MNAERKLAALSDRERKAALAALDELSRPMTKIEIEDALRDDLSRSIRRPAARALFDRFEIIMVRRKS